MEQKTKPRINWVLIKLIIYSVIGLALGFITGFRTNMLKVHATGISGTNLTFNEGQVLKNGNDIAILNGTSYVEKITIIYASGNTSIITNYDDMLMPMYFYSKMITISTSGTVTTTNAVDRWNVEFETSRMCIKDYSESSSCTYYTIVSSSGYTEEQYLAYGEQQYNAGYSAGVAYVQTHPAEYNLYTASQYSANYTAGQNSVLNNPNTYNLYTSTQYNNYGTSQYNSGYSAGSTAKENDILTNPNNYGLYSSAQYTAYGTNQYNAGVQYVVDHPSEYNLYTQAQYEANYTAGQNSVLNSPNTYNLYTQAQYSASYDVGYNDGENAGENNVIDNPNDYDLYNQVQLETAKQNSYSDGYQEGINSFEYEESSAVFPTYGIYSSIGRELNISNTNIIKPSNYLNYTSNYIDNGTTYITLESYQYEVRLSESVSSNITLLVPTTITNLNMKFCNSFITDYYLLGEQAYFCRSIASNQPSYNQYENWGIDNVYYNKGIDLNNNNFNTETYDNVEYYIINLQEYVVGESNQFNIILLSDISSNEYSNILIALAHNYVNSQSYNLGYQNGYNTGNLIGSQTASQAQYNKGYNDGYNTAKVVGDNSITGLANTILSSPVNMFSTIFDFEFLGVNLASFILSIVTLLIVIWLIKRFV